MNQKNVRRRLLLALAAMILIQTGSLHGQEEAAPVGEDRVGIEKAVRDGYIRGLETRDFSLIRNLCLPGTIMQSGGRDGRLRTTTMDEWAARFEPGSPPFESLESTLSRVDQAGTAAQVRIDFVMDGSRHIVDFLHLIWVDGAWRVSHIIDYSFSQPLRPAERAARDR